jgi:small subunit ribosomal protein S17
MKTAETKRKTVAIVVSDKMDKSRIVVVERQKKHPVYGKYIKVRKKFCVHDAENKSKIGDKVVIQESIPISKRKKWVLLEILGQ